MKMFNTGAKNTIHTEDIKQSSDSPPGTPLSWLVDRVPCQEWLLRWKGQWHLLATLVRGASRKPRRELDMGPLKLWDTEASNIGLGKLKAEAVVFGGGQQVRKVGCSCIVMNLLSKVYMEMQSTRRATFFAKKKKKKRKKVGGVATSFKNYLYSYRNLIIII